MEEQFADHCGAPHCPRGIDTPCAPHTSARHAGDHLPHTTVSSRRLSRPLFTELATQCLGWAKYPGPASPVIRAFLRRDYLLAQTQLPSVHRAGHSMPGLGKAPRSGEPCHLRVPPYMPQAPPAGVGDNRAPRGDLGLFTEFPKPEFSRALPRHSGDP